MRIKVGLVLLGVLPSLCGGIGWYLGYWSGIWRLKLCPTVKTILYWDCVVVAYQLEFISKTKECNSQRIMKILHMFSLATLLQYKYGVGLDCGKLCTKLSHIMPQQLRLLYPCCMIYIGTQWKAGCKFVECSGWIQRLNSAQELSSSTCIIDLNRWHKQAR